MKKKSVVIIVIIAIVILCIAFFSYNYWKQGTPEYSFQQAQKAFSNHDTITFSQYFDSSEVFGNYWTRLIEQNTKAISEDTSSSQFQKAIDITNLNNSSSTQKTAFANDIYNDVTGKNYVNQPGEYVQFPMKGILTSNLQFIKVNNGVAYANFIYQNYGAKNPQNYPVYNLKVMMTQQSDRHWKVTDIQGYEDANNYAVMDVVREQDIQTIGNLINQYIDDSKQPILDANNWRPVLGNYALTKGQTLLPEDPVALYSDANKYVFAISNADSLQNYTYIIRAKLGTITDGAFQTITNINNTNLTYLQLLEKISGGTNSILGVDCSPPAYCYMSFGNGSSWLKLLSSPMNTSTNTTVSTSTKAQ